MNYYYNDEKKEENENDDNINLLDCLFVLGNAKRKLLHAHVSKNCSLMFKYLNRESIFSLFFLSKNIELHISFSNNHNRPIYSIFVSNSYIKIKDKCGKEVTGKSIRLCKHNILIVNSRYIKINNCIKFDNLSIPTTRNVYLHSFNRLYVNVFISN